MSVSIDVRSTDLGDVSFRGNQDIAYYEVTKSRKRIELELAEAVGRVANAYGLSHRAIAELIEQRLERD
jgi:hypothetical protein